MHYVAVFFILFFGLELLRDFASINVSCICVFMSVRVFIKNLRANC